MKKPYGPLVVSLRASVTIDWDKKESVQARMRVHIKRILKKWGYPPEKQEAAVKTILEQAKTIGDGLLHGVGEGG